jgi:sec-independent protein translocase protein TatA
MNPLVFAFLPSGWEIFVILFVVLLLFGGRKIPELMRGLGKGIREFNSARATVEDEIRKGMTEDEKKELEEDRKSASKSEKKKQSKNAN